MTQLTSEQQNVLKNKKAIVILTRIALIFTILYTASLFIQYEYWEYFDYTINQYKIFHRTVHVGFPGIILFLFIPIALAPCVLMTVYISRLHEQFRGTVLIPIIFGVISIAPLYQLLLNINDNSIICVILAIAAFLSFGLVALDSLNRLSKKMLLIIAFCIGILTQVFFMIEKLEWCLESKLYLYLLRVIPLAVGSLTIYTALFLFAFKNSIPSIKSIQLEKKKRTVEKMSPEQALVSLKNQLDLGVITEEEYSIQRSDIISKL